MKQKKEVFAKGICFEKILWVFLIGSVFGVIMETIISYFQFGDFQSRKGLIYGPLNPVYGFGTIIFLVFLIKYKNPVKVFFGGMLLGGGFEYGCSLLQEKIFGTTSWNYSNHAFNIDGRTSLFIMICWGLLALLFVFIIYPPISDKIEKIPVRIGHGLSVILVIFLIVDCSISISACLRQSERAMGIEASNSIDVFLDKHYPDKRLNEIFQNARRKKEWFFWFITLFRLRLF